MKKKFSSLLTVSSLLFVTAVQSQPNTFPSSGFVGIGTTNPQQRLHVEGPSNQAIFVNTSAVGPISGSGMIGYVKGLPTAAGNRLGYFLLGSRGGANNNYNVAGMIGYAAGAWTQGVSHPAYLAFETTPSGATARIERLRITEDGNLNFANSLQSIQFANPGATSNAMMNMFVSGTNNPARMVIAHSPAFQSWGLRYTDANDQFDFLGSGTSRLAINLGSGNVGVGTATPAHRFMATNNSAILWTARIENLYTTGSFADGLLIKAGRNTGGGSWFVSFQRPDGTQIGSISQATATSVGYNTTSDKRLKANILESKFGLADVNKIQVRDYNFIGSTNVETGFLAQQLYEVFPGAVTVGGENAKERPWMVDYGRITPLLVKAIQELSTKTDEVAELRKELADLKELVSKLTNTETIRTGKVALSQNNPNPVRGKTLINYSLPDGFNRAQLVITDVIGRTIKTIQLTSSGAVNVDTSPLSNGVYNYSLVVEGKKVETKKMIVER